MYQCVVSGRFIVGTPFARQHNGINYLKFRIRFIHHAYCYCCLPTCIPCKSASWLVGRSLSLCLPKAHNKSRSKTNREHIGMSVCTCMQSRFYNFATNLHIFRHFAECVKFHIVLYQFCPLVTDTDRRYNSHPVIVFVGLLYASTIQNTLQRTCNSFLIYFCTPFSGRI